MKEQIITPDQLKSSVRIKKEQFVLETKKIAEFVAQIEKIRKEDPFRFEREAGDLQKQLLSLRISEYQQIISQYQKQNPKKYEAKKEAMEAVLVDMKQEYDKLGKEKE